MDTNEINIYEPMPVHSNRQVEQKVLNPPSGMLMLVILILLILGGMFLSFVGIVSAAVAENAMFVLLIFLGVLIITAACVMLGGLRVVGPNEALVLTLFGKYYGTILKQGFFWVNPFAKFNNPNYEGLMSTLSAEAEEGEVAAKKTKKRSGSTARTKKTISLKRNTLNNGTQKVNDVMGNPIIIGAIVIWRVVDPTKAVFNVEDYTEFLSIQTDSTIRNTARLYPYDNYDEIDDDHDDGVNEMTLRGSSLEIAQSMKKELAEKVEFAGLLIEEVRITHLAYSEEIAAAMLQRQQAAAIIAARTKIVDGAVSMVKMAIDKLNEDEIVELDEERKAQMVSNLLVVLCAGKDPQPVVNSGSIY